MGFFKAADLRHELLDGLAPDLLATLDPDERAAVQVSTGEMGNKPDTVKLGWLKMRTGDAWTKQRYTRTFRRALEKLREQVEARQRG